MLRIHLEEIKGLRVLLCDLRGFVVFSFNTKTSSGEANIGFFFLLRGLVFYSILPALTESDYS